MPEHMRREWGVGQWAAFLSLQTIPCLPLSQQTWLALEETQGERLSSADLTSLAVGDPFLCLRLLREAEQRRSRRLGRETTTPLSAIMQIGVTRFRDLVLGSTQVDAPPLGLTACISRAVLASQLARIWGRARADIAPDEVAMASLLGEIGELLLWQFAPELPEAAQMAFDDGRATRSAQAQEIACGFRFRELSLQCASLWDLPDLLVQLIRGADNTRANLCKLYLDTARHLSSGPDNPALPHDLAQAKRLIPQAGLPWLAAQMVGLDEERQAVLVTAAQQILDNDPASPLSQQYAA